MPTDLELARRLPSVAAALRDEIGKVVVGQRSTVDQVLTAVFARGHCLVQGVPGLAKTLLVSTLARAMDVRFSRIQFTPDLMPGDVTGTDILQEDAESGRRRFEFQPGPVFANLLLADEVNRAPPKAQAALLQAMAERQVTVGSRTFDLPDPFFVLATQNPIEQEGTYPLPEAQLDRFMFMVSVDYPPRDEELDVLRRTSGTTSADVRPVVTAAEVVQLQRVVRAVPVSEVAYGFALDVARATRPQDPAAGDFVRHWLRWGAGTRAAQDLVVASQARALMAGRLHVTPDDVVAVAPAVLRHRLIPTFNADAEGVTVEQVIDKVLTLVPRGPADRLL
jgi:MoxR-like ATPase